METLFKVAAFSLGLMIFSGSVHAAQSNFQISPPPIASPEFSAGKEEKKVTATYVGITGTGLNLNGAGGNLIVRDTWSEMTAKGVSVGAFYMSGTMNIGTDKGDLSILNMPFSINIELQPVKNDNASLILFGGAGMSLGFSSLEYKYTLLGKTYTNTTTTNTFLYGLQGGAQVGIKAGDFTISPFGMVQSQQGTASSSSSSSAGGSSSTSVEIPAFTSTSYGLDILYRPWNLTLSSMLQEAAKSGSGSSGSEGFKTTVISLSWNF